MLALENWEPAQDKVSGEPHCVIRREPDQQLLRGAAAGVPVSLFGSKPQDLNVLFERVLFVHDLTNSYHTIRHFFHKRGIGSLSTQQGQQTMEPALSLPIRTL